jgi:hypothetical protein
MPWGTARRQLFTWGTEGAREGRRKGRGDLASRALSLRLRYAPASLQHPGRNEERPRG